MWDLRGKKDHPISPQPDERFTLRIDLQEGFARDAVAIKLNGKPAFSKKQVSTQLLLGKADSFTTAIAPGPLRIDLEVKTRKLQETIALQAEGNMYIGVSIVGDRLIYSVADKPYGYM
jgi:hypothetical protein